MPDGSLYDRMAATIRRRWLAISICAALLLLYAIIGFFVVPRIAQGQMQAYATQTLHRQVTLRAIHFNPFTLEVRLEDFSLRETDGTPLIAFKHLLVNAELASLWQRAVNLKEVRVEAPDVQLIVDAAGKLNLAQLAPPSPEPSPETSKDGQSTKAAPPPRVRIGLLSVSDGRIGIEDRARAKPFATALAPIRFTLTEFKTDLAYENAYNFSAVSLAGEELNWSGEFTVQPLGSSGQFGIRRLKAATIKSYLDEALSFALTSGEVALDGHYRVALDPTLALDVDLSNIAVREFAIADRADETKPVITMPAIDVNAVAFSFSKRSVGVKSVTLRGAHLDLRRERNGDLNVLQLFAKPAMPPDSAKPTAPRPEQQTTAPAPASTNTVDQPAWQASVDNVQLADASVTFDDFTVAPAAHFDVQPIAFNVSNWSTAADAAVKVTTIIGIDKQGNLTADGTVRLQPLSGQIDFKLGDFSLPSLQSYLATQTQLTVHSGRLQVQGNANFSAEPEAAAPLKFVGSIHVDNLRASDNVVNEDLIKWQRLAIDGISASLNPDRLTIERVVVREPYVRVAIAADQTVNVSRALSAPAGAGAAPAPAPAPAKQAAAQPASPAKPMPIRIKRIQVVDGSANFADNSIQPSFATAILELNGTVTGLSSDPASRAQVKLAGKVDRYAPVDISGEINVLAAAKYSDVALNFANMELTTFNPYSGKFAGYNISKGKLSTQLRYRVEDRKLDAQHHIVVDNLEFGDKTDSKDAAPIPLKLAIALLKDRNGVIDIEVPISGTLDDPEFRLAPIIWKAVVGLLKKIAMAPFAAIGALFGGGDELAYVEFDPGLATLSAVEIDKLNKVAQGLVARPELKLNIPLTALDARDANALAQQAFTALLPPALAAALDDPATRKQRIAILEAALKKNAGAVVYPALDPASPAPTPDEQLDNKLDFLKAELLKTLRPSPETLAALARQRANAVQAVLLTNREVDPQRVFLTNEPVKNTSDGRFVRMEMQLE